MSGRISSGRWLADTDLKAQAVAQAGRHGAGRAGSLLALLALSWASIGVIYGACCCVGAWCVLESVGVERQRH
jgi:hypothetical protein